MTEINVFEGVLHVPNKPEIEGRKEYQGDSWHTAEWPEVSDSRGNYEGKKVAIIGNGASVRFQT